MNRKLKLTTNLIWQYFNQQIFNRYSVWNFRHFWYLYQITLFRKCWEQESAQHRNHQY